MSDLEELRLLERIYDQLESKLLENYRIITELEKRNHDLIKRMNKIHIGLLAGKRLLGVEK
jgi:hypothetical protein